MNVERLKQQIQEEIEHVKNNGDGDGNRDFIDGQVESLLWVLDQFEENTLLRESC